MRHRRRTITRAGFTMIELLMTLVLIGIIAGLTVPRLDWARFEADAGGRQVRVALQTAQRLAVTQQSTVVVGIDSARGTLRVLEDVNGNLRADAGERVTWRPLDPAVRFAAPPAPPSGLPGNGAVLNLGAYTVDGLPSVVFRRDGSASARAILYIAARKHGDTQYRAIVVTQSTGRVDWWTAHQFASGSGTLGWRRANL